MFVRLESLMLKDKYVHTLPLCLSFCTFKTFKRIDIFTLCPSFVKVLSHSFLSLFILGTFDTMHILLPPVLLFIEYRCLKGTINRINENDRSNSGGTLRKSLTLLTFAISTFEHLNILEFEHLNL